MRFVAFALLLPSLALPSAGRACTAAGFVPFVPDEGPTAVGDRPPPAIDVVEVVIIGDGLGPIQSSCDDVATVELRFVPPADDHTPAARMGYQLAFVDGVRPTGSPRPEEPVLAAVDGRSAVLRLDWLTGGEPTEPFRISIMPIDGAGQPAATATTVDLEIPAPDAGGCQVGRGTGPSGLFGVLLLVAGRRRRTSGRA